MITPHSACGRAFLPGLALLGTLSFLTPLARAQTPAEPAKPSDGVLQLDPFEVNSDKDYGYRKTNSVTASRIGIPTIDTPLNIQVIGADFLEDIGVDNIQDAFRYTSGVSVDYGNEFRPSLRLRGFAPDSLYRDGFLRYYNFDLDGIEQIEVVKGPNAVFFGRTAPGGIINYITKKPQFRNQTDVELTYGDHQYYKALLDTQFTTDDKKLGVRIIGSKVDANSWLDEKTQKKEYLLANLSWHPFSKLEIFAGFEHTDNKFRGTGIYGMVHNAAFEAAKAAGTSPADETLDQWRRRTFASTGVLPPSVDSPWFPRGYSFNKNGGGSFEQGIDSTWDLQAKLELTPHLHLRTSYNLLHSFSYQGFFINGSPDQLPAPAIQTSLPGDGDFGPSGPVIPANNSISSLNYGFLVAPWDMLFDRPTLPYLRSFQENGNHRSTVQADLVYDFEIRKTKHTLVASFDRSDDIYKRKFPLVNPTALIKSGIIPGWAQFFNPSQPMPYSQYINPFQVGFNPIFDTGYLPLDVLTLKYNQIPDLYSLWSGKWSDELGADSYYGGNRRTDTGYSLNYNGKYLDDRLIVTAGIRHATTESSAYDNKGPKGEPASTSGNTPMVGANLRISPGVVLFASFNRSFQVPAAGFEGARNPILQPLPGKNVPPVGGEAFPNETGKGYDLGLKTDFKDNMLSGTVSIFRVDRQNVLVQDAARQKILQDSGNYDFSTIGNGFFVGGGLQRTEGTEADLTVTPNRNYQAIISGTWTWKRSIINPDPSTINVARGGTFVPAIPGDTRNEYHAELAGVPEFSFGFFNRYLFSSGKLKGLGVGGGLTYESSVWPDPSTDFGFREPGYILFDALLSYDCEVAKAPVRLSLVVDNVLDKHYFSGRVGYGAPRTWKMNASVKF